jgi:hypothetical protein
MAAIDVENFDEFEFARKKLRSAAAAERSRRQEALKRQAARSAGGLSSGAFLKLSQQAEQEIAEREKEALEGIQVSEAQERRRKKEIEEARQFQREEVEKQRQFARGEREAGQKFAREESGTQREFTTTQAELQRTFVDKQRKQSEKFQSLENKLGRDFTSQMQKETQSFQQQMFDKEFQLSLQQLDLQKQAFDEERRINDYNIALSEWQKGQKTDIFSSLFGQQAGSGIGNIANLGTLGLLSAGGGPLGSVVGAVSRPVSGAISKVTSFFCFIKDTMIALADGSSKKIQDLELGDKLFGGGHVTRIGTAYAQADLFEIDGEICTGNHSILNNGLLEEVKDIQRAKRTSLPEDTVVYPIDTSNHFYVTESGNISLGFIDVEDAISPQDELDRLNRNELFLRILKGVEDSYKKEKIRKGA